jgi:hypothetical protein
MVTNLSEYRSDREFAEWLDEAEHAAPAEPVGLWERCHVASREFGAYCALGTHAWFEAFEACQFVETELRGDVSDVLDMLQLK